MLVHIQIEISMCTVIAEVVHCVKMEEKKLPRRKPDRCDQENGRAILFCLNCEFHYGLFGFSGPVQRPFHMLSCIPAERSSHGGAVFLPG